MHKLLAIFLVGIVISETSVAQRNVEFIGDFETGKINPAESADNGFFIHTLPDPQSGSTSISSSQGGFGANSDADTRVISVETVGSETIRPRNGDYFLRSVLFHDKNYTELNSGLNKPRSKINPSRFDFDFDVEGYIGFSIYLPANHEIENKARRTLLYVMNTKASATLLAIALSAPEVGAARWAAMYTKSDRSISEGGGTENWVDLGPISADLGKWTDFVVRFRWNPFEKRTNASTIAGGKNQEYDANKGVLQIWKSQGPADQSGEREMQLTDVNIVNAPVGLVPRSDLQIRHSFKVYKPTWQTNSTTINGPIWIGFDEIRIGYVLENGTDFGAVHPGGLPCLEECDSGGGQLAVKPEPPANFTTVN